MIINALDRPQSVPLQLELRLPPRDPAFGLGTIWSGNEVLHDLRVGVQGSKRVDVTCAPAAHRRRSVCTSSNRFTARHYPRSEKRLSVWWGSGASGGVRPAGKDLFAFLWGQSPAGYAAGPGQPLRGIDHERSEHWAAGHDEAPVRGEPGARVQGVHIEWQGPGHLPKGPRVPDGHGGRKSADRHVAPVGADRYVDRSARVRLRGGARACPSVASRIRSVPSTMARARWRPVGSAVTSPTSVSWPNGIRSLT